MIKLRKEVCVFLQCYRIFVIEDIFFFLVHPPDPDTLTWLGGAYGSQQWAVDLTK